jgi:hypothetical protein
MVTSLHTWSLRLSLAVVSAVFWASYRRLIGLVLCLGILSMIQISRIKLFRGYRLGTGLISVVGTSFATLSTADAVCSLTSIQLYDHN